VFTGNYGLSNLGVGVIDRDAKSMRIHHLFTEKLIQSNFQEIGLCVVYKMQA